MIDFASVSKISKERKMQKKIKEDLQNMADSKYKEFHSGLCPGTENILGVRVPELKKYAKKLVDGDFREYLSSAQEEYYEEILLQGLVISYAKMQIEEKFQYLDEFVPKIDNWAVCDITVAAFKDAQKNREKVWEYLEKYWESSKEFERRFAVVMLLDHFLVPEYLEKVIEKIEGINREEYYVKMAVAWLVSIAYIKFPERMKAYLEGENSLDIETRKKAIQKIRESTRVSKEEKEYWKCVPLL